MPERLPSGEYPTEGKKESPAEHNAQTICSRLGLPDTQKKAIADFLSLYRDGKPPVMPKLAMQDHERVQQYATFLSRDGEYLYNALEDVLLGSQKDPASVRQQWESFLAKKEEFEKQWADIGRPMFMLRLGLPPDMPPEDFESLVHEQFEISVDVPRGATENVMKAHSELERDRPLILGLIRTAEQKGIDPVARVELCKQIVEFLMKRFLFEHAILGKDITKSRIGFWVAFILIASNEALEELFEAIPFFKRSGEAVTRMGEKVAEFITRRASRGGALAFNRMQRCPFFEQCTAAERAALARAWQEVALELKGAGLSPLEMQVKFGRAMRFMGRLPGTVAHELFKTFANPGTFLLFAFYLESATDKWKAMMQFSSFIEVSKVADQLMNAVERRIRQEVIAGVTERTGALKAQQKLARLKSLTGVASRFVVSILLVMLFHEEINDAIDCLDKMVPDNPVTDWLTGVGAGIFGSGTYMTWGRDRFQQWGVETLDPRVGFKKFMRTEFMDGTGWQEYRMTIEDWNQRVRKAIEEMKDKNPVLAAFFRLQLIEDTEEFANRMSVDVHMFAKHMYELEEALNEELSKNNIGVQLNGVDIATSDAGSGKRAERNDRRFRYARDRAFSAAKAYFEKFKKEDPQRMLWEEYITIGRELSEDVSVYRHLAFYNRDEWIGSLSNLGKKDAELPKRVGQGLIAKIVHFSRRQKVTRSASYAGSLTQQQVVHYTAAAIPLEGDLDFFSHVASRLSDLPTDVRNMVNRIISDEPADEHIRSDRWAWYELIMTAEAAAVAVKNGPLSQQVFDDAMEKVRVLFERPRATRDEILEARQNLASAILEANIPKEERIVEARPELQKLIHHINGVNPQAKVFVQGAIYGDEGDGDLTTGAFAHALRPVPDHGGGTSAHQADVHLIQGTGSPISWNVRIVSFFCRSAKREEWCVVINDVSRLAYWKGHEWGPSVGLQHISSFTRNGEQRGPVSFTEWVEKNKVVAQKLNNLVFTNVQQEQENASQKERQRFEQGRQRAQESEDLFVQVGENEFQRRYHNPEDGTDVMISFSFPPKETPGLSETKFGSEIWVYPRERPFTFTVLGTKNHIWTINGAQGVLLSQKLTLAQKNMIRDIVTTPIEGHDRESLLSVINCFAQLSWRAKSAVTGGTASGGNFGVFLVDSLLPRYQRSRKKKAFLTELFSHLMDDDYGINEQDYRRVATLFKKKEESVDWLFRQ